MPVLVPELFGLATVSPFTALVAFRPVLAMIQLAGAMFLGLRAPRQRRTALAAAGIAAVSLAKVAARTVPASAPAVGRTLSILSFNVEHGRADVPALAATIRLERPDLVVLPEAGHRFRGNLDVALRGLGYRSWVTTSAREPDVLGIVVLAATTLGDVTATTFDPGSRLRWMRVSGGALGGADVIAVHTVTPVRRHLRQWAAELRMLRYWCADHSGAHIVVGDVNATLDHATLRAALNGARDVAADCGHGLISTWPSALPRWLGAQIDHVFTTGGPVPLSFRVLDLPGSDHRAIIAQVVLPHLDEAPPSRTRTTQRSSGIPERGAGRE